MSGRWITCGQCEQPIYLSKEQEETLRRSSATFYCLWGHSLHFPQGDSREDKLRRERDRLKQDAARLEQQITTLRESRDAAERRTAAMKGQVTRLKNRAANGVCPCCNRTFANLQRHMASKHAGFVAEEVQAEVGQAIQ